MEKRITLGRIYLRFIQNNLEDRTFIKSLFQESDIQKYYVLRNDHSNNIELFAFHLSEQNTNKNALNYIIESELHVPVGLLTAELQQDDRGHVICNVAYATLSMYRRRRYAYEALLGLINILKNFKINTITLDISQYNIASSKLAEKCGFKPMTDREGGNIGYIDPNHIDLGIRYKWIKDLNENIPQRDKLNLDATKAFRSKDYTLAIELFLKSLKEPLSQNSPYSDGQIFSNLGMAYTNIRQYAKAYECLSKAYQMGIRNDSVIKELNWLKNNAGLG